MKTNEKYRDLVSPAAKVMVNESLEIAESADDLELKNKKLRESLDRVYNEVRLPDVYSPSTGPLVSCFRFHFSENVSSLFKFHVYHRQNSQRI